MTALTDGGFGDILRQTRLDAGMSLSDLARRSGFSKSHVSKVESGAAVASPEFARRVDAVLEAAGRLAALVPLASDEGSIAFDEHVERAQRSVVSTGRPVARWAAHIEPAAVDEVLGVFGRQLRDIRTLGQTFGPSVILPMLEPQTNSLVDLATHPQVNSPAALSLASQFANFTSWMAQEAGDDDAALRWSELAAQLAKAADDEELAAYAYVRLANIALYRSDSYATIAMARKARGMRCGPRVRQQSLQREAQGHALAGNYDEFRACIEDARSIRIEGEASLSDKPVIGTMHVKDPVALAEGWSLHDLGYSPEAVEKLEPLFRGMPRESHRAWARVGARLALAYAGAGRIDAACDTAESVVGLFPALESATIRSDLRLLSRELGRWNSHPRIQGMRLRLSAALTPERLS